MNLHLIPNDYENSKKLFKEEKLRLLKFLHNFDIKIEHIGSTAIPKTIGKGIIDILLICENHQAQIQIKKMLIQRKYRQGELEKKPDGRLFFYLSDSQQFRGGTEPGHIHFHLVTKNGSQANLASISMRDYLLSHPEDVKAYNQEKIRLANSTNNNRHNYAVQKENFIKNILAKINN